MCTVWVHATSLDAFGDVVHMDVHPTLCITPAPPAGLGPADFALLVQAFRRPVLFDD
jgi:hypothetical protein